jgi:hypothetical protein
VNAVIGLLSDDRFELRTLECLTTLLRERHEDFQGRVIVKLGYGGYFDLGRKAVVGAFLETNAEWLLTIDSDQTFSPYDWDQLTTSAEQFDVVSGLYFKDSTPPQPLMCRYDASKPGLIAVREWIPNSVVIVDAVPSGFLLVHRGVFETILGDARWYDDPRPWYAQGQPAWGEAVAECDYQFCFRAQEVGSKIGCDTSTRIGHIKPRVLGLDDYRKATA